SRGADGALAPRRGRGHARASGPVTTSGRRGTRSSTMLRAVMISLALTLAPAAAIAAPADGRSEGQVRLADGDAITLAITVVHARPSDGGVAPELDKLSRYLLKSFPKHKSFVRLSATSERLAVGAKGSMTLPNGIELVFGHT